MMAPMMAPITMVSPKMPNLFCRYSGSALTLRMPGIFWQSLMTGRPIISGAIIAPVGQVQPSIPLASWKVGATISDHFQVMIM